MEPLGFELRDPGGADVTRERHHADGLRDFGELGEARDDLVLGLLVMFEQDRHQNTLINLATWLSMSGKLGCPVGSWPVSCAYSADSANSRSACTRFGT